MVVLSGHIGYALPSIDVFPMYPVIVLSYQVMNFVAAVVECPERKRAFNSGRVYTVSVHAS